MTKQLKKAIVISGLCASALLTSQTLAWADEGRTDLFIGGSINNPKVKLGGNSTNGSGKTGLAFGISQTSRLSSLIGLETGIYLSRRAFRLNNGSGDADYRMKALELPVIARFNFSEYFNLGLGGYFATAFGDATVTPSGGSETTSSVENAGFKSVDLGWVVGAQVRIPLNSKIRLLLDLRRMQGLKNLKQGGSDSDSYKTQELLAFTGIGFGF